MGTNAAVDAAVSGIDYTIGENVDTLRRRTGITIADLAQRFGVSASAMSLKLHGKRSWSALDTQQAAQMFNVRMAQLTGEDPMPEPTSPPTIVDITTRKRPHPVNDPKQNHLALITNITEWRKTA